ncbi:hypothetical protein [Klenkia brasiliensis]|uniref:Uncharacterized protein n=1 Tax=Klenkia brasiliensis TaxID=333142 RepID=A0A1G7SNU2_9ACTN|nr:hypothetical protein [Klenkia brasiliensis]SDG24735.1 hypothetical protein SAMN05660324_2104 [Klenkia brasiliensis]
MTEQLQGLPGLALLCARAALGGLLSGGFAAWAYYDDLFRELSHTFGLWILLVVLVSARRPWRPAVLASTTGLAVAVAAFYIGKDLMYALEYPGMPYAVNLTVLAQWLVLAGIAGPLLGWVFSHVGRVDLPGTGATAAAVGLLVADAARRTTTHSADPAVLLLGAVAVAVVLVLGIRTRTQLLAGLVCAVPCAGVGTALVSAPDLLEQLLLQRSAPEQVVHGAAGGAGDLLVPVPVLQLRRRAPQP